VDKEEVIMEDIKVATVHMVPTQDETQITRGVIIDGETSPNLILSKDRDKEWDRFGVYQHLHFTTDEDIEKGDTFLYVSYDGKRMVCEAEEVSVAGCFIRTHLPHNGVAYECWTATSHKLIASTDKSIKIPNGEPYISQDLMKVMVRPTKSMPQPRQSFIEEFVERGGIDKVNVGYTVSGHPEATPTLSYKLVVNRDNTINIELIKREFSRQEVDELISKLDNIPADVFGEPISGIPEFWKNTIELWCAPFRK